jgi:uncharacterized iron-regulated membrane protein
VRRALFLIHRWLGIGIALLMLVWAASGIVMMYVAFPETSEEERLAGLQPLDLSQCCEAETTIDPALARDLRVEMLAGHPALMWIGEQGPQMRSLDGSPLPGIGPREALGIAGTHMERTTGAVPEASVSHTGIDQWTVYGSLRQHRPLYKVDFADEAGTTLYVSGMSGTVVQDTTAHERFWNWLGAVPHWLYFTAFRTQQALWSNFVIYSSLLGVFLTVTGIYVGIRQFGRGKRKSPYRGLALWHHWTGLIFGAATLTWVVSGLFSMQPWGMFESDGPGEELAAVAGRPASGEDLASFLQALKLHAAPDVVSAELSMQDGAAYAVLAAPDGKKVRAELGRLAESPLRLADLERRARRAKPGTSITEMGMIEGSDAYYYAHKDERIALPAFRIIYGDEQQTRLYFDPRTGALVLYADAPRRAYRWLHYGLHRLDFFHALRQRPLWDVVVVPLLLGVSLLCLIGLLLGGRRLIRNMRQTGRN